MLPPVFYIKKKMQGNLKQRCALKICVKLGKVDKESKDMLQPVLPSVWLWPQTYGFLVSGTVVRPNVRLYTKYIAF